MFADEKTDHIRDFSVEIREIRSQILSVYHYHKGARADGSSCPFPSYLLHRFENYLRIFDKLFADIIGENSVTIFSVNFINVQLICW